MTSTNKSSRGVRIVPMEKKGGAPTGDEEVGRPTPGQTRKIGSVPEILGRDFIWRPARAVVGMRV